MTRQTGGFDEILLLEDNASAAERRRHAGVGSEDAGRTITVRVHRINGTRKRVAARKTYEAGIMRSKRCARLEAAAGLLGRAATNDSKSVVVAGTSYGSANAFLTMLCDLQLPFVVQVRPSKTVKPTKRGAKPVPAGEMLERGAWREIRAVMPDGSVVKCSAAKLGSISLSTGTAKLFAAQVGGIKGVHRGTIIGVSSFNGPINELVQLVAHARWIRRAVRRKRRAASAINGAEPSGVASSLTARANIALARRQDARARSAIAAANTGPQIGERISKATSTLNIVELFSGAGGMGLGFLLADKTYRIVYSGEANPIFVQTLRRNHQTYDRVVSRSKLARTPEDVSPTDLRKKRALNEAVAVAKDAGGAHFLIGGPPCQGFSTANRNSWSSQNPNNELIDVFIRYIVKLRPLGFLMENVQGILWTPNAGSAVSVVDVIERRLKAVGYVLFPKLLDAAWYGVPQNRTRFFLMGLHRDLGYSAEDFGEWGPFPRPTHGTVRRKPVTVRDAIADLPRIGNGHTTEHSSYAEPSRDALRRNKFLRYVRSSTQIGAICDHVTSRHADYVIERYRKIPAGGNWESIRDELTNYADVSRTHSNIYRRLMWDEPSITIGHYRKSMLVHPSQHRGLSLREAARLQSFPDWFRFAGTDDGRPGGLVHKQQQLANAVCPLVTKAIAKFIREL